MRAFKLISIAFMFQVGTFTVAFERVDAAADHETDAHSAVLRLEEAGCEIRFPRQPEIADERTTPTRNVAYVLQLKQPSIEMWFYYQQNPIQLHFENSLKRVLTASVGKPFELMNVPIEESKFIEISEHLAIEAEGRHPETLRYHRMIAMSARFMVYVAMVGHDGTPEATEVADAFISSFRLLDEPPGLVGEIAEPIGLAVTVDIDLLKQTDPALAAHWAWLLRESGVPGRAERYEGSYEHPPLEPAQREVLKRVQSILKEAYPSTVEDLEHDVRLNPRTVEEALAIWKHMADAFEILADGHTLTSVQQKELLSIVVVVSRNSRARAESNLPDTAFSPMQITKFLDRYYKWAARRPE